MEARVFLLVQGLVQPTDLVLSQPPADLSFDGSDCVGELPVLVRIVCWAATRRHEHADTQQEAANHGQTRGDRPTRWAGPGLDRRKFGVKGEQSSSGGGQCGS